MKNKGRSHIAKFKAKVAFEAAKGDKTIEELASEYGVHPTQITQWRKQLLEMLLEIFFRRRQNKKGAERCKPVSQIKKDTRRRFNAEEKIRIVLEGLRGQVPISELCRREGISAATYYKWPKDFLDAGKNGLTLSTRGNCHSFEPLLNAFIEGILNSSSELQLAQELARKYA